MCGVHPEPHTPLLILTGSYNVYFLNMSGAYPFLLIFISTTQVLVKV